MNAHHETGPVINPCPRGIWPRGRTKEDDRTHRISAAPARLTAQTQTPGPGLRPAAALLLRVGYAALLAWIENIHLHLRQEGNRQIPTDGPLFLPDAVAGFVLASVPPAWPRPLAGLLAAGYTTSTPAALIISLSVGLFDFREPLPASFAAE